MMRSFWWWLPASLLSFGACVDIDRTPPSGAGGAGGEVGVGTGNEGGIPADFQPTPCVQKCVDMTPEGTRTFALVAACTDDARANACADVCDGAATGQDPGPSTCAVPGHVDAVPACNICLKQNCCDTFSRCFSDIACITIGICPSGL